ncbi:MAG: hypothetical protein ACI4DN_02665 [Lachnospiraceae bacterium]
MKAGNIIIAGILAFGLIASSELETSADDRTKLSSCGRIEYHNRTPENTLDDVIFDAHDLQLLAEKIKNLEIKIRDMEQSVNRGGNT